METRIAFVCTDRTKFIFIRTFSFTMMNIFHLATSNFNTLWLFAYKCFSSLPVLFPVGESLPVSDSPPEVSDLNTFLTSRLRYILYLCYLRLKILNHRRICMWNRRNQHRNKEVIHISVLSRRHIELAYMTVGHHSKSDFIFKFKIDPTT